MGKINKEIKDKKYEVKVQREETLINTNVMVLLV